MPDFRFHATDDQGKPQQGTITAASLKLAAAQLQENAGWMIIELTEDRDSASRSRWEGDEQKLAETLADLTASQLPLEQGLRVIAEEMEQGLLTFSAQGKQYRDLADRLDQGMSLDEALQSMGAGPDLLAAIQAGRRSGNPATALAEYTTYFKSLNALRVQISISLIYPLLLILSATLLFLAIMVRIVPKFSEMYTGFGIDLPWVTTSLLQLSGFLCQFGMSLFVVLPGLLIGIRLLLLLLPAYPRHLIAGYLPVVGPLGFALNMSRFCHTLGYLVDHQVLLAEGLRLAGTCSRNKVIEKTAIDWAVCLKAGESLAVLANRVGGLPAELFEAFLWQEHPEQFSRALHGLGRMYEDQARSRCSFLIAFTEPVIVFSVGLFFLWVVVGLFFPVLRLMNDLS